MEQDGDSCSSRRSKGVVMGGVEHVCAGDVVCAENTKCNTYVCVQ